MFHSSRACFCTFKGCSCACPSVSAALTSNCLNAAKVFESQGGYVYECVMTIAKLTSVLYTYLSSAIAIERERDKSVCTCPGVEYLEYM